MGRDSPPTWAQTTFLKNVSSRQACIDRWKASLHRLSQTVHPLGKTIPSKGFTQPAEIGVCDSCDSALGAAIRRGLLIDDR
jgi:hypothetical protein